VNRRTFGIINGGTDNKIFVIVGIKKGKCVIRWKKRDEIGGGVVWKGKVA